MRCEFNEMRVPRDPVQFPGGGAMHAKPAQCPRSEIHEYMAQQQTTS